MIELKIDGQGYELDDELKDEIHTKIGGLDEHMDSIQTGHVTVTWEGGKDVQTKIHVQLWGSGHRFEASDIDRAPSLRSTTPATSWQRRSDASIARTSPSAATADAGRPDSELFDDLPTLDLELLVRHESPPVESLELVEP